LDYNYDWLYTLFQINPLEYLLLKNITVFTLYIGVFLAIVSNMRIVDMSTHHVVKTGIAWPFSSTPNCKKMIGQLERNEALVTWICPNNGDIKDQIPAIRVKDNFYTMSLRMMKVRVIFLYYPKK
jgi:hypothetical protein